MKLLNGVLQHEKPELDARRIQLLREEEQWNVKLEKLQDNLLQELTAAQGDILQNKASLLSLHISQVCILLSQYYFFHPLIFQ